MPNQTLIRSSKPLQPPSLYRSIRNIRRLTRDPKSFFTELMAAHPGSPVIPFARLGRRHAMFVTDLWVASQILTNKNFGLAEILMQTLAKQFGRQGPFTTEGSDWQKGHDLCAPLFRRDEVLAGTKAGVIDLMLKLFVGKIKDAVGEAPIDILSMAKNMTINLACEVIVGADLNSREIVECGEDIENLVLWTFESMNNPLLLISPFRRRKIKHTQQRLHSLIEHTITNAPPSKGFVTALSLLAKKRLLNEISHEMFFSIILQIITAGHETSASAIAWLCRYLATDGSGVYATPHLREEATKLLAMPIQEAWGYKDFPGLSSVANEVLLRFPPIISVFRAASCDITIADENGHDVFFPQGTLIYIPLLVLNREQYERYGASPNPFSAFSFSKGRRMCPGGPLAIRILLTTLALLIDKNIGFKIAAEDGHIAHLAYKPHGLKLKVIQL